MISIVLQEIRLLARDGRLKLLALLALLFASVALVAGAIQFRERTEEFHRSRHTERQHWLQQAADNPHGASHFGVWVFRQPTLWESFEPGLSEQFGNALFLESHHQNEMLLKGAHDEPAPLRLGPLSPAWLFLTAVPLALGLVATQSWSSEIESGRLRLLLSLGAKGAHLRLGKALSLWLLTAGVLGLGFLSWALFLGSAPWQLGGLFLILVAALGVAVIWGAVCSYWAGNGSLAALGFLTGWLCCCFLLPPALAQWARSLFPTPSRQEVKQQLQEALLRTQDEHQAKLAALKEQFEGAELDGRTFTANEERETALQNELKDQVEQSLHKRRVLRSWGMLFSPYLAARYAGMAICGTDQSTQDEFLEQAEEYRFDFVQQLNGALVEGETEWSGADWDRVAAFEYRSPDRSVALTRALLPLGVLALWIALGLFLLAHERRQEGFFF